MKTPKLIDVVIKQSTFLDSRFIVTPVWDGVDWASPSGYDCGSDRSLAESLKAAFISGACYGHIKINKTITTPARSYVSYTFLVSMFQLDHDLSLMGFNSNHK